MESIKLKIDESNQVKFKLHVQGTTSESGAQDPEFRFVLSEQDDSNTLGYIFPVKKEENGTVSVVIPPMEGTLKEQKSYIGKMEVLMGSRYFTPSTLQIEFEKEFKITAEAVIEKSQKPTLKEKKRDEPVEASVTSEYVTVKSGNPKVVKEAPSLPQQQRLAAVKKEEQSVVAAPKLKLTKEDIVRIGGDEKKLKRFIAENFAKQISPKNPKFVPLVESTFNKIRDKVLGSSSIKPVTTTAPAISKKMLKESNNSEEDKIDVEDLMNLLWNNKHE